MGDILQEKIAQIFKDLPKVFDIAGDNLIAGYDDGTDHYKILCRVLQICRKENPKLNQDKYHFRCTSVPFLRKSFLDMSKT